MLITTDNAVESNGANQRNFLLAKKMVITDRTGIMPNTDTFHQFNITINTSSKR